MQNTSFKASVIILFNYVIHCSIKLPRPEKIKQVNIERLTYFFIQI